MSDTELKNAIKFMGEVPEKDKCFAGWNFDIYIWSGKLDELVEEFIAREIKRA